jgi:hypothetical protein
MTMPAIESHNRIKTVVALLVFVLATGTPVFATIVCYRKFGGIPALVIWCGSVFLCELGGSLYARRTGGIDASHGSAVTGLLFLGALLYGFGFGITHGVRLSAEFAESGGGIALWYVLFAGGGMLGGAILWGAPALLALLIVDLLCPRRRASEAS